MTRNFHRKIILFISVFLLTLNGASASNSDTGSASSGEEASFRLHPEREVILEGPIGYSSSTAFPYGFQQKDLAPPFKLEVKADPIVDFVHHHLGIWASGGLYFLHNTVVPILEASTGVRWSLEHYYFSLGGQITDQSLATEGPSSQSQFNTTYYGIVASAGYTLPNWDFGFQTKILLYHDTPIQGFEGVDTEIAHESTEIFSPTVKYFSPFGLNGLAGLDIYQFGRSAVASKEFGYGIQASTTVRLRAGVTYDFKPFEVIAEARFVLGSQDPLEQSYRAIFLDDDYLLSPTVVSLGVAWHF